MCWLSGVTSRLASADKRHCNALPEVSVPLTELVLQHAFKGLSCPQPCSTTLQGLLPCPMPFPNTAPTPEAPAQSLTSQFTSHRSWKISWPVLAKSIALSKSLWIESCQ
jgi:hypothetical protein